MKVSHEVPSNFIPLIEHCLTTTYFSYNIQFYEQASGAAMGSPISPFANIFMEHFEKEVLKKCSKTNLVPLCRRYIRNMELNSVNSLFSSTINIQMRKTTVSYIQSDGRILSIFSYIKRTTDRIGRILNKHNIRTIFKPSKKIGQILRNSKVQRHHTAPQEYTKYLVPAGKHTLEKLINLKIKEHQRDVRLKHVTQSALSEYNIETENTDETITIANITSYFPKKRSHRDTKTLQQSK